jgi:hypothetical protein
MAGFYFDARKRSLLDEPAVVSLSASHNPKRDSSTLNCMYTPVDQSLGLCCCLRELTISPSPNQVRILVEYWLASIDPKARDLDLSDQFRQSQSSVSNGALKTIGTELYPVYSVCNLSSNI